ncbi:ATPase family AAA domain-containing protein 1-A, partial [Dichanthelium oligosanthes]
RRLAAAARSIHHPVPSPKATEEKAGEPNPNPSSKDTKPPRPSFAPLIHPAIPRLLSPTSPSANPQARSKIGFLGRRPARSSSSGGRKPMRSSDSSRFVQELVLYAASAAFSCLVLFAGLRHLDPNRAASQKAQQQKKEIAKRLGRPLVSTTPYEDVIACDVINPDSIDVEFDSIGGLDHIKQALYELVILPLRRPELFTFGKLLSPQKGVLLYGPPGTGKTMLAKAIARESGAVFINVRISNLMSKWFGDAQKLVAAVFSLAHKLQPAIIFIDEVDSFLGQRRTTDHEAMTNMKTEFMSLWDGFTTDQNARVMVLAATNRPSELDEAILRRFTQIFEIGIPVQSERSKILQVVLKGENVEPNIDYDHIARLCEGFTGSDILELCKQAAFYPIRELLDSEKNGRKLEVSIRSISAQLVDIQDFTLLLTTFISIVLLLTTFISII